MGAVIRLTNSLTDSYENLAWCPKSENNEGTGLTKPMRILTSLTICALLAGVSVRAEQITVSQSLDKFEMDYESQAHFEIVLTWPGPQSAYLFDKPLQPQLENLKVKQFSSTVSSSGTVGAEVTTKKFEFTLTPSGSGLGRIEPVTINYVTWPDSVPGTLVTEAMSIKIATPKVTKGAGEGGFGYPWYLWLTAAIVLVGGASGVAYWRRKAKRPKVVLKSVPEQFLERLGQVRIEAAGDLKRFQTGLYKQLVWYVNARYGLGIGAQPTEEIVQVIDSCGMPDLEKSTIGAWLIRADREKFSPATPMPGETIRLETEVREFFEKMIVQR